MRNDMHLFSLKERIFFVKTFYKNNSDLKSVKNHFLLEYGALVDGPTDSLIFEVINLFEETGSVREIPGFCLEDKKTVTDSLDSNNLLFTDIKLEEPEIKEEPEEPFEFVSFEVNEAPEAQESQDPVDIPKETPKKRGRKRNPNAEPRKRIRPKPTLGQPIQYECVVCNKKLISKRGIQLHMRRHTSGPQEAVCKYCKEKVPSRDELKAHIEEKHAKEIEQKPPKKCPICLKIMKGGTNLKKHMITHSETKAEICHLCGKGYKTKESLIIHLRIHAKVTPYKCDYPNCNRAFNNTNSFTIHKRCHTGEKPFSCEECGKSFRDKGALRIHHRQHTGETPYKCELCGKTTKQKQNLKSHMKHFHHINTFKTQGLE